MYVLRDLTDLAVGATVLAVGLRTHRHEASVVWVIPRAAAMVLGSVWPGVGSVGEGRRLHRRHSAEVVVCDPACPIG